MKNEKVAKGRIIGLPGPCYLIASLLPHPPWFLGFDRDTDGVLQDVPDCHSANFFANLCFSWLMMLTRCAHVQIT